MPEITKRHNLGESGAGSAGTTYPDTTATQPKNQAIYQTIQAVAVLNLKLDEFAAGVAHLYETAQQQRGAI